jgi:hypothetical protein
MFKFCLLDSYPWEKGIVPDFKNEKAEFYIEEQYTYDLCHTRIDRELIKELKDAVVALCRLKDGTIEWVFIDKQGVFDGYTDLEAMFVGMDKWQLIYLK